MSIWLDLIVRELLFVALLATIGAGAAAYLPTSFDGAARVALAPAFGLCIGICLTVTLAYPFAAGDTAWVLIPLALASLALARWRKGLPASRPSGRNVMQLAALVVVILASFSYPLAIRHTVGPDGGYKIADTTGYVSETDGVQRESIRRAARMRAPYSDLTLGYWSGYASRNQQLDLSALEASVNDLLGLGSTDTQSPFLIAVLLVGALGAYGVVRAASGRPTWAAVLAGCLFAGPLFAELFMDGSQGAITGSALLLPAVMLGVEALRSRTTASLVLFALLAAGLQTAYPLFVPALVLGGGAALALLVARRLRGRLPTRREVAVAGGRLGAVLALAAVFTPVAFARNADYWVSLLSGSFKLTGLPIYHLPTSALPGWVLQTREFYNLESLAHSSPAHLLMSGLLPTLFLGVIAFAVRRHRVALVMLLVAAGASLLAYYTGTSRGCSYCVQRNLIPVVPLAACVLSLGIATLAALRGRGGLLLAGGVAAVTVVAVAYEAVIERERLAGNSYLLEAEDRQAVSAPGDRQGAVQLEGFGTGLKAPMELPLVYSLVDEKTGGNVSLQTETDDNRGLLYFGGRQPLGPSFRPDYRYVLTHIAGVHTQRRVVARHGAVALEQRLNDLDVTVAGGVSVAPARFDPTGTAWVGNLLRLLVVGGQPGRDAWISVVLRRTVPVTVFKRPRQTVLEGPGGTIRICAQALGTPPVRRALIPVAYTPQPPPATHKRYADPLPARGVRLESVAVSVNPCTGR